MYNVYYFIFEFGAILTFFLILRREYGNKQLLETLILAFAYGLLLEINNTQLSQSYYYSKDFLFQVYSIPLAIAAGWAIAYYLTRKFAEKYQLKWHQAPFFMAFVAVIFDMALDPIAIRLGFWVWRIPLGQEFFGVPYDNLVGWVAAIWTFSLLINLSERIGLSHSFVSRATKYAAAAISPILLSIQITIFVAFSAIFSGRFAPVEILEFYRRGDFGYAYAPEVQIWKSYFFGLIFLALAIYSARIIIFRRKPIHLA